MTLWGCIAPAWTVAEVLRAWLAIEEKIVYVRAVRRKAPGQNIPVLDDRAKP